VHSSTFNFEVHGWSKSWLLALIIVILLLGALEFFWRAHGHQPAIIDDQRLWAIERNKIGKSQKEIALLGSSRMQTDISTQTLRDLAPQYSIINLSADGTCANAVLRDLAEDSNFKGTAIVETTSECLMFGDEPPLSQQFYIDYFHKTYNLNIALNRHISTFVQKRLTILDPYLNFIKIIADLVVKRNLRSPNYLSTHEDRTRDADYTKLDISKHRAARLKKVQINYSTLARNISTSTLEEKVIDLNNSVKIIQQRGGKVLFVRFPVSDSHWIVDELYFPRHLYWDNLPTLTTAYVWHFRDIEGINQLQCPDTSHLDVRDKQAFTRLLFNRLTRFNGL
jgi:hypothetical protein